MNQPADERRHGSSLDVHAEVQSRLIERLVESEKRHRDLLDELPDVVLQLDDSGCIQYLNTAWTHDLGFEVQDAIGSEISSFVHPDDRSHWSEIIRAAGDSVPSADKEDIIRFVDNEGAPHWMSVRVRRLDSGEIVGGLVDITVRRQLETELLRAQRLESIGRLAGGLAHDFNNLLTVILGNVNLAETRLNKKDITLAELDIAKRACHHASQLTKQMLTFSKGGEPVRRPGSLVKLVQDAVDLALRGSNVRPVLKIDETASAVEMDASQIHQVLNNIIINAEQAMPSGGILRVHVREQLFRPEGSSDGPPQSGVAVEFRDSGAGIPAENLEHVLEPYFTTKETGNGLGLTSVYWIVKRHGGLLEIESAPGAGTVVRVILPAAHRSVEVDAESGQEEDCVRSGRVLVMDDDENVRASMEAMLEEIGFDVVSVADGEECLQAYIEAAEEEDLSKAFGVVILDLTIAGGRDGVWAIDRLKKFDPNVQAVVVSGYSNAPILADFKSHGFEAMLPKPFLLQDLERVVGELMDKAADQAPSFKADSDIS